MEVLSANVLFIVSDSKCMFVCDAPTLMLSVYVCLLECMFVCDASTPTLSVYVCLLECMFVCDVSSLILSVYVCLFSSVVLDKPSLT